MLSHFHRRRVETEEVGLHAILDDGNLGCGNIPVTHQVILEGRRHDNDAVGATIKKSGDCAQRAMEQGSLAARADGRERFRPKIAYLEDEGDALPKRQPPPGKGAQQLRRRGNDHVRLPQSQTTDRCRNTERRVVANPLMRFSVGQRPQPRAHDAHAVDRFRCSEGGAIASAIPRAPRRSDGSGIR